jgi:hypothetical protein
LKVQLFAPKVPAAGIVHQNYRPAGKIFLALTQALTEEKIPSASIKVVAFNADKYSRALINVRPTYSFTHRPNN